MGGSDSVHPTKKSCCLSSIFFCWTIPVFFRSLKRPFSAKDLFPPLSEHESSRLGDKLESAWNLQLQKPNPSLWQCIFKVFGGEFFKIGLVVAFNEFVIKLSQPISMWKLIRIHNPHENIHQKDEAYIYAFFLIVASFANVLFFQWAIFNLFHLGAKVKVACGSLIYRKSLKLTKNTHKLPSNGQIVNLLSNDLNRFDKLFLQLHYLWLAPIQSAIVLYLLYTLLDLSAITGIAVYFFFIPLHLFIARKNSHFRDGTATKTDERVRLIDEIISAIHVIKMYTWENLFVKLTNKTRKEEVRFIRASLFLRAFQNSFNKHINTAAVFVCILVYVLTGNTIKSEFVFVIKTFYFVLKNSMTNSFPEALKTIAEAKVSVRRIKDFLMQAEVEKTCKSGNTNQENGILLKFITAKWISSSFELCEVDFKASAHHLVAIVGPTGSGKTSLVKVMLQELSPSDGYLRITGRISYAPQEAYLVAGTIKQNIVFGQTVNEARYKEVVKVCALEHDFQILPYGDGSVIGSRGCTLSGGQKARINLARAVYQDADIYLLDDPLSALDVSVGRQIFTECFLKFLKNKCIVLVTHQLQFLQKVDDIYLVKNGKVVAQGSYENLTNLGYFSHCGEHLEHKEGEFDTKSEPFSVKCQEQVQCEEVKCNGSIAWKIYLQYFLLGGWCSFFSLIGFLVMSQFFQSGSEFFEAEWINLQKDETERKESFIENNSFFSVDHCIYIYGGFMVLILIFTISTSIWFYNYFTKVAIKLHNKMFSSIINAKMYFFYNNPTGSILNRFSKDMGAVDTNLPKLLLDTLQIGLNAIAVACVIGIVNPWLVFASALLFCEFYMLRSFYLRTGRELKRIEAESRSPIFSHLSESLHGLETIRAFGIEAAQRQKFDRLQNRCISALHTYYSCSTAFSIWLDLSCACYISIVTYSCFWGRGTFGANMGLIITQAMGLANLLQFGMKQWCDFENEMISVERIAQYSDIETENNENKGKDEEDGGKGFLPLSGNIEFEELSLRYKLNSPKILKNINLKISANQKIGIVGRTGAGKSSITAALFRLAQLEGAISIGGVDISGIPVKSVRSQISIIPQEPVLFTGTVRDNLDPFNEFGDEQLWKILEELELKEVVLNFPAALESRIFEKGSNLSVGQRQLFCLARALLRDNSILILDEATANVDIKTDSLIQTTIKRRLSNCTVFIIAHRLNTVMDCDNVLVLDSGEVREFDHPHKLLQNENGVFFSLVSKTGHSMTEHLKKIALRNYGNQELENTSRI